MDDVIKKRWGAIVTVLYFAMILAAFYLVFKAFFSLLVPFIFAFLVAVLLHRPVRMLSDKTPLNRSVVSTVLVLLIVGVFGMLLFFAGSAVAGKVKDFYAFFAVRPRDRLVFRFEAERRHAEKYGGADPVRADRDRDLRCGMRVYDDRIR